MRLHRANAQARVLHDFFIAAGFRQKLRNVALADGKDLVSTVDIARLQADRIAIEQCTRDLRAAIELAGVGGANGFEQMLTARNDVSLVTKVHRAGA
jgi:hypothetical protein